MITIGIVDDEPLILAALRSELAVDYDVLFAVQTEAECRDELRQHHPDLLILDILLGDSSGVDIARAVRQLYPRTRILVLTIDSRRETIRRLLEIGIDGFVSKKATMPEIRTAVDRVMSGETYYGKDTLRLVRGILLSIQDGGEPTITPREVELLQACCSGKNAVAIGEMLHISPRTVEVYKSKLFVKLGVENTTELVIKAIQLGIVSL